VPDVNGRGLRELGCSLTNCSLYNNRGGSPGFHSVRMQNCLAYPVQIVPTNLNPVVASCHFDSVEPASGDAGHHVALGPNWHTLIEAGVAAPL
jgi:hypothetical protein